MAQEPVGFIRMTNQRRVIIEVLKSTNSHPTADWIYERVREKLPNISLATVYSNLRRLVDQGEIRELHCGANQCRYDGDNSNHAHFVCQICQKVYDLALPLHEELKGEAEALGYQVVSYYLHINGLCPDCKSPS